MEREQTSINQEELVRKLWSSMGTGQRLSVIDQMDEKERAYLDQLFPEKPLAGRRVPLFPAIEIPAGLLEKVKDQTIYSLSGLHSDPERIKATGILNVTQAMGLSFDGMHHLLGHYYLYATRLRQAIRFQLETLYPELALQITHANLIFPDLNVSQTILLDIGKRGIEELGLRTRPKNALKFSGVFLICQLMEMTDSELSIIRNIGSKSFDEIKSGLRKYVEQRMGNTTT